MALFLVATPIGNLEDITLRALRILRESPVIAAEDTRAAKVLLRHHGIATPVISYHDVNKRTKLPNLLARLQNGDVALISEAGTPGINDPGYELVVAAAAADIPVVPVPGPSAPIAALAASGLPTDSFVYAGFLPRKSGERRRALQAVAGIPRTLIFFEAPHRLRESLADVLDVLGDRPIAVCRELTKLHEEIFRGTVGEAIRHFTEPRGEFVLVIGGAPDVPADAETIDSLIDVGIRAGTPPARLAADIASQTGERRQTVYRRLLERLADGPESMAESGTKPGTESMAPDPNENTGPRR